MEGLSGGQAAHIVSVETYAEIIVSQEWNTF
jgi:hypothetical protein